MNVDELISTINSVQKGKVIPIYALNAYAVNADGFLGVGFYYDFEKSRTINEKFNQVFLSTATLKLNDKDIPMLLLYTKNEFMDEHYGALCLDFLDLERRETISSNPLAWFNEWSTLLGNTKIQKMVYDVCGELKVLTLLHKRGLSPRWESIRKGTFDISTTSSLFEVKTTKSKTNSFVTIHNQFQLMNTENKLLHLIFVRVEEYDIGESINDLRNILSDTGYPYMDEIDQYLNSIGFGIAKQDRYKKYIVHEIRDYLVDDDFPVINRESFIDKKFPAHVVKIEYTVSLDGIPYKSMLSDEEK